MEQHQEPPSQQSKYHAEPDWAHVLGRIFDDLAHIIQMEARLFEGNLGQILVALTDRTLAHVLLIATMLTSGWCLLAALVIGLHRLIPWWASFAVAAGAVFLCGIAGYVYLHRAARKRERAARAG
jgi:hypothetical protein